MKKWLWIIVACIIFAFSLLAYLPAQLVVPERYGKLQFLGVGGSVWKGEIGQILYDDEALPVQHLQWTVRPLALLTGSLEADFHEQPIPSNQGHVAVNLLSRKLELQTLHWQFPGDSLNPWFRAEVGLQGRFVLDLQTLQISKNETFPSQLEAQLDWQNAVLRVNSEIWQIGSPLMRLSSEGPAIDGVVTNSQPMLPGEVSFQCAPGVCQLDLNLQPSPDAPQSLPNWLLWMGLRQTGDQFSGQVTIPLD